MMHDIIIVGGGPAGLTAAVYALRGGKTALVIEKNGFGGQIAYSPKVENIPGTRTISGAEFAEKLTEQAMALGADVELETVVRVEADGEIKRVYTEEGSVFEGRALILATGVKHRMLGLEGETDLIGNGISFCAVCDGAFYTDRDVIMVGGGNSALQEALLLSEVCKSVTVVQNLPFFTGEKTLADALVAKENVKVLFSTLLVGYLQQDGQLTGVRVRTESGEEEEISADGVFLAVGLVPENEAFAEVVALDERGYFDADETCKTAVPGVFVAGDCRRKSVRQVTTAACDGTIAATAAADYLNSLQK
ncbi:MAG: FAD-dependent oxidoreductase [Clostridia bacterium]|nr:FAD-dependent oxidoreductase [Clostridia bacterium]